MAIKIRYKINIKWEKLICGWQNMIIYLYRSNVPRHRLVWHIVCAGGQYVWVRGWKMDGCRMDRSRGLFRARKAKGTQAANLFSRNVWYGINETRYCIRVYLFGEERMDWVYRAERQLSRELREDKTEDIFKGSCRPTWERIPGVFLRFGLMRPESPQRYVEKNLGKSSDATNVSRHWCLSINWGLNEKEVSSIFIVWYSSSIIFMVKWTREFYHLRLMKLV